MIISKNNILSGQHKPILMDYGYLPNKKQKPVIVFVHGFKGFKDWGHFNKMMQSFIEAGFVFVKFNFSHNGGTVEQPIDFPDLEAFGNNNYSIELDDLRSVMDWVEHQHEIPAEEINQAAIYLIGHSRGGGVAVLGANEDARIKKLVTWAAVADLINRLPQEQLDEWKANGVIYIENARTNQQMPMYYQFAENVLSNKGRLNIERAEKELTIPHLIVHGTDDQAVKVTEAEHLKAWNPAAELLLLEGANHTFGTQHPFTASDFPEDFKVVLEATIQFLQK